MQKKIASSLARSSFNALAADEPVLSVAAVAVYSWDWSSFRVLVKCLVVGAQTWTAVVKEEALLPLLHRLYVLPHPTCSQSNGSFPELDATISLRKL